MKIFALLSAVCVVVTAAPPSPPLHYRQRSDIRTIDPLEFLADTTEITNFYNPLTRKQGYSVAATNQNARLETLEPDSEVELIPGAQQPQQPPQQTPVAPNLPGLAPGQRVFIVHMPIPGYRPGSIGGYQPVYIVAAAPQGNSGYATNGYAANGYPANGYQNAVLLNPANQFVNPYFGYPGGNGIAAQGAAISQNPQNHGSQNAAPQQQGQASQEPGVQAGEQTQQGFAPQGLQAIHQGFGPQSILPQGFAPQGLGAHGIGAQGPLLQGYGGPVPQGVAHNAAGLIGVPLGYSKPFNQFYQNPYGYQFAPAQSAQGLRSNLQFSQLVNLQQAQSHPANTARNVGQESIQDAPQQKRVGLSDENETKESVESPQNHRPTHSQNIKKA